MTEKEYYQDVMKYMSVDGYYYAIEILWHGDELFTDLKGVFGYTDARELTDVASSYQQVKNIPYQGRGSLTPLLLMKKADSERYVLIRKDQAIVIAKAPFSFHLDNCTPARFSGYVECTITIKSPEGKLESIEMEAFSKVTSNQKQDMNFHACTQIKTIADFFRSPWRMEVHGDV